MFYGSPRSRIVHYQQCGYVRRSRACSCSNMRQFYTLDEAKQNGYRMCKCCDPVMNRFKPEQREITRFCNDNNIFCRLSNGEMEIITRESHWKAQVGNGSKIQLYHQNRRGSKHERRHYHVQKYDVTTAMNMLDYIVRHDEFTSKPSPHQQKKKKPRKGTKRYATQVKREKKSARRRNKKYVLDLIDAMAMA